MSATVIIPTTGSPTVRKAIQSVLDQSYPTECYLVCDGEQFYGKVKVISDDFLEYKRFHKTFLPINVGANGFYGHRIYAAFTHLVNTDYVLYLDQDNWYHKDHVKYCVEAIQKQELQWTYSLRDIYNTEEEFVCRDDCESLGKIVGWQGYHHVDTSAYCLRRDVAIQLSAAWHGGWGQDRKFLQALQYFCPKSEGTGQYTLHYRLGGNNGSVQDQFFMQGNKVMFEKYGVELPWQKRI